MTQEQRNTVAQVLRNVRRMKMADKTYKHTDLRNIMVRLTASHCLARAGIKWEGK